MTTTTSRPANLGPTSTSVAPDGTQTPRSTRYRTAPTLHSSAEDPTPRSANLLAEPMPDTLDGTKTPRPTTRATAPIAASSAEDTTPRAAINSTTSTDTPPRGGQLADRQSTTDAHSRPAVGSNVGPDPAASPAPKPMNRALLDPALALAAEVVDDLERVRIANENRLRQLTRTDTDVDGEERGFGLPEDHPDVLRLAAIVQALVNVEHDATLNLQRLVRRHPLNGWVKANRGVGEKQAGRLLASIGDPYWRPEIVREDGSILPAGPRTVSALWAYAGLHVLPAGGQRGADAHTAAAPGGDSTDSGRLGRDAHTTFAGDGGDPDQRCLDSQRTFAGVAPKRARGQHANWSTDARMRVWNVAEACKKQLVKPCTGISEGTLALHFENCVCGRYRIVYDNGRAKYADALHALECVRCGPKGKPALVGSPLSAAHQDARALRLVMKEVLKDLWRAAKDHHERENA